MKTILTILLILITFSSYSQKKEDKVIILNDSIGQDIKSIDKQTHNYKRFGGSIRQIDRNKFNFDDKLLIISNTSDDLKRVFEIGILYPGIIVGTRNDVQFDNKELDSTVITLKYTGNKTFNSIFSGDSLIVTDFVEFNTTKNTIKVKRFKFLLFFKGFANPTEYYIELTNDKATTDMDTVTFIDGARLTQIWKGSILI